MATLTKIAEQIKVAKNGAQYIEVKAGSLAKDETIENTRWGWTAKVSGLGKVYTKTETLYETREIKDNGVVVDYEFTNRIVGKQSRQVQRAYLIDYDNPASKRVAWVCPDCDERLTSLDSPNKHMFLEHEISEAFTPAEHSRMNRAGYELAKTA